MKKNEQIQMTAYNIYVMMHVQSCLKVKIQSSFYQMMVNIKQFQFQFIYSELNENIQYVQF
jgi:5,10-methylene-tetrahydrofolate dehydrogenase/methenyl tetrahydrofolate cyclohydrolase